MLSDSTNYNIWKQCTFIQSVKKGLLLKNFSIVYIKNLGYLTCFIFVFFHTGWYEYKENLPMIQLFAFRWNIPF